jgi:hypothetical protein
VRVLTTTVVPAIGAALAVAAGVIHLAHNYLPMQAPASASSGPPADAGAAMGGASGWMSMIMPHLSQVMLLNCAAFVGLAIVLVAIARLRAPLRVLVDVLLAGLSLATLYAWNAMGRANPAGTGTLALLVELALIVIVLGDAVFVAASSSTRRQLVARSAEY